MNNPITILLADDHELIGKMLSSLLESEDDMQVVGSLSNTEDAIQEAIRLAPDVCVLDIDMPGPSCFQAARTINARCPNTKIIFLSAFVQDRYVQQALDVGAAGYVNKKESPQTVLKAIRAAAAGDAYFSADVQERIAIDSNGARLVHTKPTPFSKLTPRELEVLQHIAMGLSKKEVAKKLHISANTVDNHTNHLMTKLNIHDRVGLARLAIREGLVRP